MGDIIMQAKDRPFTKFAAQLLGDEASKRLQENKCPLCGGNDFAFEDELSVKEFRISGMCKPCQDNFFKEN